jgi:O-Antigen ligase
MSDSINSSKQLPNKLPLILVILGSVLVCIWPMQHTIALRNILLALSSILGMCYCWQWFKSEKVKLTLNQFLPLILLGLMFCWVIFHYFFLAQDPQAQYQELTSTWLRSALSVISGFALGLVISSRPKWIWFLGAGLFASFLVLYGQYLPRVLQDNSLTQLDYFNYVFYGKHNAVLQGSLLLALVFAMALNQMNRQISLRALVGKMFVLACVTTLVLFAYVYMFDTRNGIGIAFILTVFYILLFLRRLIHKPFNLKRAIVGASMVALIIVSITDFAIRQSQTNLGWKYLIEDVQLAVQIDKYPNWQNPGQRGYPTLPSGRQVMVNTYERLAWATAASKLIAQNPLGNGVLHFSFGRALKERYPNIEVSASHSAWLELGLAFGLPALILIMGALCLLIVRFVTVKLSPFTNIGVLFGCSVMVVYTFAELIGQHGLESLFYWITLLSGLQFWYPQPASQALSASKKSKNEG